MQALKLIFVKEDGKTVILSIDNPITPVNAQVVNQVMDTILSSSVFSSIGENTRKKGARLIEKTVSEVQITL
ncbi:MULTISPECIES: DUF2922 domain-containing protein [Bacillus]|uniref:Potassium channel protein n=1 Tax=Bacillus mycoides TaxID=1405 RepID=A0A1S9T8D8_BACMY|nr:DUF2922 domain-containing protein [Bacillus mycoides]EJS09167.1 hypothetical protein IKM_00342 [Bacillus mycoides]MDR4899918.1 DUF2922 domain-containing protein [Bacillus mycoides]MED0887484.1 DUF2922 domain-containing protein [Bacillus mycoides]MED0926988.1 DUF2922 domain-containing protein [Bacillus mycoides]MED0941415.1 DUF2922 domain-containing protein [Bacillus mycoides]